MEPCSKLIKSPLVKKQPRNPYFQAHTPPFTFLLFLSPLPPTSKALWKHRVLCSLGAGAATVSHQLLQQQMTRFPEVICHAEAGLIQDTALRDLQRKSKPSTLLRQSCKLHTAFISASVCKGVVTKVLLAYHGIMAETQRYTRHYTEVQHI